MIATSSLFRCIVLRHSFRTCRNIDLFNHAVIFLLGEGGEGGAEA